MPRFSIIVPLLNQSIEVENTLASLLRYQTQDTEIVVAHDASQADPYDLGDEVVRIGVTNPNLIQLFNAGVRIAQGSLIGFVRPGVEICDGWSAPVHRSFLNPSVGSVCPNIVNEGSELSPLLTGIDYSRTFQRQVVEPSPTLKSHSADPAQPLGPSSWAGFYRRAALRKIGHVDSKLDPLFLDLEIALSLKTLGFQTNFQADCLFRIADPTMVWNEANLPHGCSAERAILRHGVNLKSWAARNSAWSRMINELLGSGFQPSRLRHALQRFQAGKFRQKDQHFAQKLFQNAQFMHSAKRPLKRVA
ncbi:MAG: glycosyltransferase family 2 protein [Planctomycetota bacterium]